MFSHFYNILDFYMINLYLLSPHDRVKKIWKGPQFSSIAFNSILLTLQYLRWIVTCEHWLCQLEIYLLRCIGDVVKHNPRVVQLILNCSISGWPLGSPFSCAKVYVSIDLLLLNIRDKREDVAVTISIRWIDVPNPLINVIQRRQMLIPLLGHPVLCSGVKVRMCLHIPEVVGKYANRNFTLKK